MRIKGQFTFLKYVTGFILQISMYAVVYLLLDPGPVRALMKLIGPCALTEQPRIYWEKCAVDTRTIMHTTS
jgi:hypothetical protein